MPYAMAGRRIAVDEQSVPPFKAEKRPDEKAMVDAALQVLSEDSFDVRRSEVSTAESARIEQNRANVIHGRAAVPGFVRRAEPLLLLAEDRRRQQAGHRGSQSALSFTRCVTH